MQLESLDLALTTPRLRLRPLSQADADAIWPWVSDPELPRQMTWNAHKDRSETLAFLRRTEAALADGTSVVWGIVHEGTLCGAIGLHDITWHWFAWRMDRAELGYWIGPPFQGRGLATEAARAVLDFAFTTLRLHKVTVGCFDENAASRRVIEKLAFRYCGTRRDHAFKDDRWHDHRDYELLEQDR